MRSIKKIQEIVDWGLCVGCGACYAVCNRQDAVKLINIESVGIRPKFDNSQCRDCVECLEICPGYRIDANSSNIQNKNTRIHNLLIGSTYKIWEGYASDKKIRHSASSGGIVTALALYALEKEKMAFVLHTGMDDKRPWLNKTVISRNREELLRNSGSRYASSSPCEMLRLIEENDKPSVFIGKPCDVAAVNMAKNIRPKLKNNLGLVLSFFCAGTPCTNATLDLIETLDIKTNQIDSIRYRGNGWPGYFKVRYNNNQNEKKIPYLDSWRQLAKQRPFRCHLCPDGLGELSDISSGDAWNRYDENVENFGISHVLARTKKGENIVEKAEKHGYLNLKICSPSDVISAQGLVSRRKKVFGRLIAMKVIGLPTTRFENFMLFQAWRKNTVNEMIRSVLGTIRRLVQRKLWKRNPLFSDD